MEEAVNDAIHTGQTDDSVMRLLIELITRSLVSKQPVFPLLDEPVLFRKMQGWVVDANAEVAKVEELQGNSTPKQQ